MKFVVDSGSSPMVSWISKLWASHRRVILEVATCEVAIIIVAYAVPESTLLQFYDNKLRTPLFTSFLTLAGFLLSLKTFIVVKMKEVVYEDKTYVRRVLSAPAGYEHFGPLRRLSELLYAAILFAFISSIAQFSVGLIGNRWAVVIAIGIPVIALVLLLRALVETRANLHEMFTICELKLAAKKEKLLKSAAVTESPTAK